MVLYFQFSVLNNGIEFIGGDEEFSVECINLIVNFDKFIINY